jgi:hypothetical protein
MDPVNQPGKKAHFRVFAGDYGNPIRSAAEGN